MPAHQAGISFDHQTFLNDVGSWTLVFAHPGHELRTFSLMERVRPAVFVLTDGSGSTATSRLDETRSLITRTGARTGAAFGALTDREAYAALTATDAEPFLTQVEALSETFLAGRAHAVVIDAAEGYNPIHDVCHWMGRAAAARARHRGARLTVFEVDLVAHPDSPGAGLRLQLDEAAFTRKLDAISSYVTLKGEADAAFQRYGQDAFRVEHLRAVIDEPLPSPAWVPYYEEVGNARVREGRYGSVLRFASHVRPVIGRILESARPAHYATDLGALHQ